MPTLEERDFIIVENDVYNIIKVTEAPPGDKGDTGAASDVPGPQGPQGVPGPQGPAGSPGQLSYTHEQGTPSDEWVVEHNLGYFPSVSVTDSGGTVQYGEITYISVNIVEIKFLFPFGGKAFVS